MPSQPPIQQIRKVVLSRFIRSTLFIHCHCADCDSRRRACEDVIDDYAVV
jgi:hypothetical protein